MAKKKKRRRPKRKFPLITGALLLGNAVQLARASSPENIGQDLIGRTLGLDVRTGQFSMAAFSKLGLPLVLLAVASKFGITGAINRSLQLPAVSLR